MLHCRSLLLNAAAQRCCLPGTGFSTARPHRYSCPEVITNQPYGESADIWAAGCILYQMVTLVPPFNSTNMLALARTIVEGTCVLRGLAHVAASACRCHSPAGAPACLCPRDRLHGWRRAHLVEHRYPALPEESCSEILRRTVAACLTPDPKKRPDIEQVCGIIAPLLLRELDACNAIVARRDRELEKERKRRQRHVMEASRNMEQYYRLFNASQDPGLGGNPSTPTSGTQSPLKLSFRDTLPSLPEDGPGAEVHRRRPASVASSRPASATHGRSVPPSPMVSVVGPLDGSGRWRGGRTLTTHGSSSSQDSVFQSDASPEAGAEGAPVPPSPSKHASRGASSARLRSSRGSTAGGRPTAGSIAIAPSKVRQISDPASQLLNQLHKIIYVTQLPPDSAPNVARHVIELYKRALFSRRNKSLSLKVRRLGGRCRQPSLLRWLLAPLPSLRPYLLTTMATCRLPFGAADGAAQDGHGVQGSHRHRLWAWRWRPAAGSFRAARGRCRRHLRYDVTGRSGPPRVAAPLRARLVRTC